MSNTQNGYRLDKTGKRVEELLDRHYIVPTLNSPPGDNIRSWMDGEYLVNFRIGELLRVVENDVESFYILKNLSKESATWEKIFPKQDVITDLETIRRGASKGETALQNVPDNYVTEEDLENKQDIITDLDTIRGNASKVSTIVDDDGYLYSNGEKVDMRFTRSLLPVGTSIPANSNLNTKEYLKIGKYYCSLNVDAKTITNCPTAEAFSMEVFNPLGVNVDDEDTKEYTYRLRVLTAYKTGVHYIQYCATSGTAGSWTYNSWFVVPRTSFSLASSKNGGTAAKGASNRGVYIDSTGTFQQMGYTVAKSVPSNAVFTDTNTKVTSVGNHYVPAEDTDVELFAPNGEVVIGIKRDAAGHVVGIDTQSLLSTSSSDWNANDGEAGHIKNRTHYIKPLANEVLEGTSVVFNASDIGEDFYNIEAIVVSSFNKLIIELPEFNYEITNSKSIVKYWEEEGIYVTVLLVGGDSEKIIRVNFDSKPINDGIHPTTVSAGEYVPLSEYYIPDTIARIDYVNNAIASAITNVLNTPV